jgi:hypothetical protein
MRELAVGFVVKNDRFPARGERIATWVENYMQRNGLGVGELAFRVGADKRDIRRLITDRSCGPRLNDDLEAAFGWDFIEQVATPVVGADPISAREAELERHIRQVEALHARIERERAARTFDPASPVVGGGSAVQLLQAGRES